MGVLQSGEQYRREKADNDRLFEVEHAGEAVAYMANLPLSVNILSQVCRPHTASL
jgi:hypothetical protein